MNTHRMPLRSLQVAGVDGCRSGWCVIHLSKTGSGRVAVGVVVCRLFREVLESSRKERVIAVDIPIGLPQLDRYPRGCDSEAKKRLTKVRGSSVFFVPPREVVERTEGMRFRDALALSRRISGRGMSQQTFHIFDKVREVDRCLTPGLQDRVYEIHPELSFWAVCGGRPLVNSKKTRKGIMERESALAKVLSKKLVSEALAEVEDHGVGRDDVLDAVVAAYSAMKIAESEFAVIPSQSRLDARGMRMQIAYPLW